MQIGLSERLGNDHLPNRAGFSRNVGPDLLIQELVAEVTKQFAERRGRGSTTNLDDDRVVAIRAQKQVTTIGELVARAEEGLASIQLSIDPQ